MKKFTIKKKRDGQDWKVLGEYYAKNWQDAKREFVDRCSNDHDIRFLDDEEASRFDWYSVKGYYLIDETGGLYPEFISKGAFDTFRYDVYLYTIRKI